MSLVRRKGPPPGPTPQQKAQLFDACGCGDYPTAKKLVQSLYDLDLNEPHGHVQWTYLHFAAHNGHEKVVKLLLIKGARPDIKDIKVKLPSCFRVQLQFAP